MIIKYRIPVLCLVWGALLLPACSGTGDSPEDQIRQFVKSAVEAIENRDLDDFGRIIHDDYLDQNAYNKRRLVGLLGGYLLRHKGLYLFTKIEEINLLAENQAAVLLYVAMTASVVSDADALAALRAQVYQFELQLIREDDWLLQHASWKRASALGIE